MTYLRSSTSRHLRRLWINTITLRSSAIPTTSHTFFVSKSVVKTEHPLHRFSFPEVCTMIDFAVIGTGWITASFVKGAYSTKRWRLKAVCSRSDETGRKFAAELNLEAQIHTSVDSLAADPSFTTVYIASPNALHHSQALACLKAGKHVVLEKPAALNAAQLAELTAAATAKRVFLLEAFRHIQEANFRSAAAAVRSGRLGRIRGATITYAQYSSRYDKVLAGETPAIFDLSVGGGALADLGVYVVCAAVALFGRPVAVRYEPVICATGADAGGVATLAYDDPQGGRFTVVLNASKCYASTAPSEVFGEKGLLVLDKITDIGRVAVQEYKGEWEELGVPPQELNLAEEAEEFARIIEEEDWKEAERLGEISKIVVGVTDEMRRANGLLFPGES